MKNSRFLHILALHSAAGTSTRDACKQAGCSERQGYAIASTQEFRNEVSRLKSESVAQAVAVLTSNATKASNALVKLLDSEDEKIILASATKLLAILPALQDLSELRERVAKIESQASLRIAK